MGRIGWFRQPGPEVTAQLWRKETRAEPQFVASRYPDTVWCCPSAELHFVTMAESGFGPGRALFTSPFMRALYQRGLDKYGVTPQLFCGPVSDAAEPSRLADALDFHFGAGEAGEVAADTDGDKVLRVHERSVRV